MATAEFEPYSFEPMRNNSSSEDEARDSAISYSESSGSLASGWSPGETLGTGILLPQDFCAKNNGSRDGAYTKQPIKKFEFFRILQSLSWRLPADQKA